VLVFVSRWWGWDAVGGCVGETGCHRPRRGGASERVRVRVSVSVGGIGVSCSGCRAPLACVTAQLCIAGTAHPTSSRSPAGGECPQLTMKQADIAAMKRQISPSR
jgi:hypothetical protein